MKSIGILAALINQIEDHPYTAQLRRDSTYYQSLQCSAEHDPSLPKSLRKAIRKSLSSDKALSTLEATLAKSDNMFAPMCGTTQAVDIVGGGVKTNALPESAFLIMNHRIDVHRYASSSPSFCNFLIFILATVLSPH